MGLTGDFNPRPRPARRGATDPAQTARAIVAAGDAAPVLMETVRRLAERARLRAKEAAVEAQYYSRLLTEVDTALAARGTDCSTSVAP